MCNPALAIMGASAVVSASAARNAAKAQQQSLLSDAYASDRSAVAADNSAIVAENNAKIAEWQARDALRQGDLQKQDELRARGLALDTTRAEAADVKSRQKVALAANGVDVSVGSANDVQTSTDYVAALNEQRIQETAQRNLDTIQDNAVRTAWGYRTQGTSYRDTAATQRADAELYRYDATQQRAGSRGISPNSAAAVSLLGSAGQVAGTWYSMNRTTK